MDTNLPLFNALVLAAVYAGTTGRLNIVGVIAAAAIGAILGDNIGYTIGRSGGYPLVRRLARLLHIDERKLVYTERYFEQHGDKTVLIGRFFAILRVWVAFLAGASRMPRRTFFVWNATGGILWATIFGTLGFVLGDNLPLLERILKTAGIGGTILLILALLSIPLIWRWRRRTERLAMIRSADALSHQAAPDAPTQETAPNAATPLDRRR